MSYLEWDGALVSAGLGIASLVLIARLLQSKPACKERTSPNPAAIVSFPAVMLLVAVLTTNRVPAVSGFVFYLFFVGFGEEMLFRGYIQSRLNQAFGRPYRFFGVDWGWGLVLASILFGLMHVINPHSPYHWWWGFWAFFSGLTYGFIREKTGSIVAPAIVHGIPQVLVALLRLG